MPSVTLSNVSCQYRGATSPAVDDISLEIEDGEFLALVGPSGCGKSTTLRLIAGLERLTGGTILIGDRDITAVDPRDRDVAMVFQSYALYPHMSVADNIGYSLKLAKVRKEERRERVGIAAEMLELSPYLDRKPSQLSGGQRQRVAMARAIVRRPSVFLMDEPLSNLDARLRVQTRAEISTLTRELGVTTIYVTHDQTEAMTMGDRVVVLNEGRIEQVDSPRELYRNPRSLFIADFIGSPSMNLFPGVGGEGTATMGIRPEDIVICSPETPEAIRMVITHVEVTGADSFLHGTIELAGREHPTVVRAGGTSPLQPGDRIGLTFPPGQLHWFASATGERLPDGDQRLPAEDDLVSFRV